MCWPLTSGARQRAGSRHGGDRGGVRAQGGARSLSPPEAIAEAYKLTLTELRVLLGIVEVGGVPGSRRLLGVAGTR